MIVVSGTAAVVLVILGLVLWIVETGNKARRLAAQRAKNRELRSQAGVQTPPRAPVPAPNPNPDQRDRPGESGTQAPSMPYGM